MNRAPGMPSICSLSQTCCSEPTQELPTRTLQLFGRHKFDLNALKQRGCGLGTRSGVSVDLTTQIRPNAEDMAAVNIVRHQPRPFSSGTRRTAVACAAMRLPVTKPTLVDVPVSNHGGRVGSLGAFGQTLARQN